MNVWSSLLAACAFTLLPLSALTEPDQQLFDKLTALMKEEIQQQKIKDREGREVEDPGRSSILLHLRTTAEQRPNELSSNLTSVLAHFQTMPVKEAATELSNRLIAARLAAETAETQRLQTLIQRAAATVKSAKEPKELDALLTELSNARQVPPDFRGSQDVNSAIQQADVMRSFLAQWQEYLAATRAQNYSGTRQALANLISTSGTGQVSVFPRSEILALAQALDKSIGDPIQAVLAIETLDDIAPALETLRKAQELQRGMQDYTRLIATLTSIETTYREHLSGLPFVITPDQPQPFGPTNSQCIPKLVQLRVMLLKLVLPRYLDAPAGTAALQDETINAFLDRLATDAKARQDLTLLSRIIGAKRTLVRSSIENNADPTALRAYAAGKNQQRAGQFELATASYQKALSTGSDLIPSEDIGQQLDAIKAAHPKDYQKGFDHFRKSDR